MKNNEYPYFQLNPLFIFILAPLTVWHLKRWKEKRQNRMRSLIKVKVTFWKKIAFPLFFILGQRSRGLRHLCRYVKPTMER